MSTTSTTTSTARTASALWATWRTACAEAAARRAALLTQFVAMGLNDLGWMVFWLLFFDEVGELRGWDGDEVLVLLAVICTVAGTSMGFLANARHLASMVSEGELDEVLRLPVPPLAHLLLRRVEPVNVGDVVFGVGLFAVVGHPTPVRTLVFLGVVAAGVVTLTSFLVLVNSLTFFTGRGEAGELAFRAVLIFSTYPVDVFAGVAKAVLYTAIPAAFVSTLPSRLVESFDVATAVALAAVSLAFAVTAGLVFRVGLRRYTSGAVWVQH